MAKQLAASKAKKFINLSPEISPRQGTNNPISPVEKATGLCWNYENS